MKITLENFGPIRNFSIDLKKDFHLLVGQNNIGKSYAITAVYLIAKNLIELSSHRISISRFLLDELDDGSLEKTEKLSLKKQNI